MSRLLAKNVLVLVAVILADQLRKQLLLKNLQQKKSLIDGVFSLSFDVTLNDKFAFSIPAPQLLIALVVGAVFLAVLILWIKALKQKKEYSLWLSLILAGAISNISDRIVMGGVIDWIEFQIVNISWSSFNFADVAIIVGALGWAIQSFKKNK